MPTDPARGSGPFAEFVRHARVGSRDVPRELGLAVVALIRSTLAQYSGSSVGADLEDLVSGVYLRFLDAARSGRLDRVDNVAGYLVVMTRRTAFDERRRVQANAATLMVHGDLADVVQLADETDDFLAMETVDEVASLLELVRSSGGALAYQVLTFMLDEVQASGKVPSLRAVGEALGVSHTAVAKALQRVRNLHGPRP